MQTKKLFLAIFLALPFFAMAEITEDSISKHLDLEATTVSSTRAGERTPVAQVTVNSSEINKNGASSQIPYLMQLMPSLVMTSENGTGSGNTQLRIRGVDASRINVSINGLPLNNPESQEVFWVNLPDLSSSLQSIQIQRGVGTSTNGSSAFGASINLETQKFNSRPHAEVSTSIGSFETFSSNIAAGTGLQNGFWADFRYAKMLSKGYIRNGKTNHQSLFGSAGFVNEKQMFKINYIYGEQHTGITWEGAAMDDLEKDWTYNPSGIYYDEVGNTYYYDNETDNYFSNIVQAFYARNLSSSWTFNAGFNYTHGYGYYENYTRNLRFDAFALENQNLNQQLYQESDVVTQKKMRNDFYAGNFYFQRTAENFNLSFGGMMSYYNGDHYGELNWVKYNENIPENYEWYRNQGNKSDHNVFAKADYTFFKKLTLFGDLQYRLINYQLEGIDEDLLSLTSTYKYNFFNPKIGINYQLKSKQQLYASASVGQREPTRADVKESVKSNDIQQLNSEKMLDYEVGYRYLSEKWSFNANFYFMNYKDQLVPTGKLSASGYKLMDNVERSYRTGIELSSKLCLNKYVNVAANLTWSQNKILEYSDQRPIFDANTWEVDHYEEIKYSSTDLSFSPNFIAAAILTVKPLPNFNVNLSGKYVGKQYYDNSSNPDNQLDAYFVANFSIAYDYSFSKQQNMTLEFFVNNLLNNKYLSNAWTYESHFTDGSKEVLKGFYAQAPAHFGFRVSFKI